jgi:dienelactone hydrolase
MTDAINAAFADYQDRDVSCEAYVAHGPGQTRRPCVLVAHAWDGQNQGVRARADTLAAMGYVGFALDVYGKGVRGDEAADNTHLMMPFMQDRGRLRRRLEAGVAAARAHPLVDADRIAVIGYCFGGLCALDVARSPTARVRGAVSFHGVYTPPNLGAQAPISAKVLVLHGWDDPFTPPQDMVALAKELSDAGADWQIHAYGHTKHAFTFPGAAQPDRGILYNADADRRSWAALEGFLSELFAA